MHPFLKTAITVILIALFAGLFYILTAFGASAATCSTSQAAFSITQALSASCVSGDNDVGSGGYFAQDPEPTLFGYQGWSLVGPVTFDGAPTNGTKSGTFSVDNPTGAAYLVVLKAGNGFGAFDMGTQEPGPFNWSSTKDLSHATVWQKTDVAPVPIPATGLLLIPALAALGALRKKGQKA